MSLRVLVAEPSAPISHALKKFLDGVAQVQLVHFLDEAVEVLRTGPPDILLTSVSGNFDGEVLCAQSKKSAPATRVILAYPPTAHAVAAQRAIAVGADGFLVGPLKRHAVLGQLHAIEVQRALNAKVGTLEAELTKVCAAAPPTLPAPAVPRGATGVNSSDEAFFKKYLLLEVKRSKRYQYPVALMIVALDGLAQRLAPEGEGAGAFSRSAIRAEVLQSLSHLTRDIDLLVPFGQDKYLAFLPHTSRSGSVVVAQRVVERLRMLHGFSQGTASVGLASFDPKSDGKATVSFGSLVKEATAALKKAQQAGGDRVEAAGLGPPSKRSRISLG